MKERKDTKLDRFRRSADAAVATQSYVNVPQNININGFYKIFLLFPHHPQGCLRKAWIITKPAVQQPQKPSDQTANTTSSSGASTTHYSTDPSIPSKNIQVAADVACGAAPGVRFSPRPLASQSNNLVFVKLVFGSKIFIK